MTPLDWMVRPLLLAAVMAPVLSCGPEPTQPASSNSSPTITLMALAAAIEAKDSPFAYGQYYGCFADSADPGTPAYRQTFDPADVAFFESACACPAPTDWRLTQEMQFYTALVELAPNDEYAVAFDSVETRPDSPVTGDTTTLHRRYEIRAVGVDRVVTTIAIGFADLSFQRLADGRWVITRWDDHVDPAIGSNPPDATSYTMGSRRMQSTL